MSTSPGSPSSISPSPTRRRVTIPIGGLGCLGSGALIVERALAQAPGVIRAYVNPATEMAYVTYDDRLVDRDRLITVIEEAGFHVEQPIVR